MGTGGQGTGGMHPCQKTCDDFFACTQEKSGSDKLCPGLGEADKGEFVKGCLDNPQCGMLETLLGLGCATLVSTVKGIDADFKAACEGS